MHERRIYLLHFPLKCFWFASERVSVKNDKIMTMFTKKKKYALQLPQLTTFPKNNLFLFWRLLLDAAFSAINFQLNELRERENLLPLTQFKTCDCWHEWLIHATRPWNECKFLLIFFRLKTKIKQNRHFHHRIFHFNVTIMWCIYVV